MEPAIFFGNEYEQLTIFSAVGLKDCLSLATGFDLNNRMTLSEQDVIDLIGVLKHWLKTKRLEINDNQTKKSMNKEKADNWDLLEKLPTRSGIHHYEKDIWVCYLDCGELIDYEIALNDEGDCHTPAEALQKYWKSKEKGNE